jgi:hypothetical protein
MRAEDFYSFRVDGCFYDNRKRSIFILPHFKNFSIGKKEIDPSSFQKVGRKRSINFTLTLLYYNLTLNCPTFPESSLKIR